MKIENKQVVVEPNDDFVGLTNILRDSIPANNRTGYVARDAGHWSHIAQNEAESLEGHFRLFPNDSGRSVESDLTPSVERNCSLYLGATVLERALVSVGLERIEAQQDSSEIDSLLRALDTAKQA